MKKILIKVVLGLGAVALLLWGILNGVEAIAYGIDHNDALTGLLRLGIPVLPILVYLVIVKLVMKRIEGWGI